MNQALKITITILGMYVFFQAFTAIANFVGLSIEDYINYLLWGYCFNNFLVIFA